MMRFASGLAAAVLAVGCSFSAVTAQTLTAIRAGRLVDVYPHGLNAMQLPYMVKYGMSPMQAIQAATISAADLTRWKDSVG
jgi:imidazolonepropionase-like amidohydrolase